MKLTGYIEIYQELTGSPKLIGWVDCNSGRYEAYAVGSNYNETITLGLFETIETAINAVESEIDENET